MSGKTSRPAAPAPPSRSGGRVAMKIAVTFEDGSEQTFTVKPRHLIAFEDEFGTMDSAMQGKPMRSMYYLAYLASDAKEPFEKWTDTLEGVEMVGGPQPADGGGEGDGGGEPTPTG